MSQASDIANAYSNAFAAANAANEKRYADILDGYDGRAGRFSRGSKQVYKGYDDLVARQALIGESDRNTAKDLYARNLGQTKGILASHGMGSAFLMANAGRGAASDYGRNEAQISDNLARQYASVYGNKLNFMERTTQGVAGMDKDRLDFMERKQDLGPQAGLYAELAGMAGRADAGIGGGAVGGGGVNFGGGGTRGASPAVPSFVPPVDPNSATFWPSSPQLVRYNNANAQNSYDAATANATAAAGLIGAQAGGMNLGGLLGGGGGGPMILQGGQAAGGQFPGFGQGGAPQPEFANDGFGPGFRGAMPGWEATPPAQPQPQFNQGFPGTSPGFFSAPGFYGGSESGYPISPDMGSYGGGYGGGSFDAFGSYGYS